MGFDPDATERVFTSNNPRIDGVLYGEKWAPEEITYSDPNQRSDYERRYDADMDGNGVAGAAPGPDPAERRATAGGAERARHRRVRPARGL